MKWNPTSVIAVCLVVGIGGFVIGKATQGSGANSSAEELSNQATRVSETRISPSREMGGGRGNSSDRSAKAGGGRADGTFNQRLDTMEKIIRGENALDRGRALLAWIDSLSPEEFESALDRFRSLGLTEARMGEYAMLLTAWAHVDPTAALAYTTEKTQGGTATGTVLTAWATRDPEAAIAWAKAKHKGDDPNPFIFGIIRGLAATNPTRATELLQEMPYSPERGNALQAMMPHLLSLSADSAREWIGSLTDERLKDGAIARLAEAMAGKDPAGTAAWLLANLGEASTRSVDEVFEAWAQKDAKAAMSSFEKLPEGGARTRALRGLVTVEARQNPQAAANLMHQYPADVDDRMVYHFIWNSFDKAPNVAVGEIAMIQDEGSQNRMYQRALDAWLDRDKPAAEKWISSANLPETVLQTLSNRSTP